MDQILDNLVEEDYNEMFQNGSNIVQSIPPEITKPGQVKETESGRPKVSLVTRGLERLFRESPKVQQQARLSSLTSAIMMYSAELDDDRTFAESFKFSTQSSFTARMESEETLKCISSSIIFFLVVVSIVTLVIINNPVM